MDDSQQGLNDNACEDTSQLTGIKLNGSFEIFTKFMPRQSSFCNKFSKLCCLLIKLFSNFIRLLPSRIEITL